MKNALNKLLAASAEIDNTLGQGSSRKYPELVGALMTTAAITELRHALSAGSNDVADHVADLVRATEAGI